MNLNNYIEKKLALKGMTKLDLHLKIIDMYTNGDYCKYPNFSEKLRKDRLTAEDLLYIGLVLDLDLNVLKGYLKKEISMLSNVAGGVKRDEDKELLSIVELLNANSLYIGSNPNQHYLNCADGIPDYSVYNGFNYSAKDLLKLDIDTYVAVFVSKEDDTFLVCAEHIKVLEDSVVIDGKGVHCDKWYVDIVMEDANNIDFNIFKKLSVVEKYNILAEDFDNMFVGEAKEFFDSVGETHKKVIKG